MKTVLITGGSRGIGQATVSEFLSNDYSVITTSTSGKVKSKDVNLSVYKLDLSKPASIKDLVSKLAKKGIKIDILVNNAAIADRTELSPDVDILRKTLEVNLFGTVDITMRLLPLLTKDAVIISISSEFASLTQDTGCLFPSYRISKTALNMFTRNLYEEKDVKAKNIKVYSFDPGWVKTDMGGIDAERDPNEPAEEIYKLSISKKTSGQFYRGLEKRSW